MHLVKWVLLTVTTDVVKITQCNPMYWSPAIQECTDVGCGERSRSSGGSLAPGSEYRCLVQWRQGDATFQFHVIVSYFRKFDLDLYIWNAVGNYFMYGDEELPVSENSPSYHITPAWGDESSHEDENGPHIWKPSCQWGLWDGCWARHQRRARSDADGTGQLGNENLPLNAPLLPYLIIILHFISVNRILRRQF